MARTRVDLKRCNVYIADGYSADDVAAVNNAAGYAAGDTTMLVDGTPAGALPVGLLFTVVGSGRIHQITAVSGGPPTTSITFNPGLSDDVLDNAVITFRGRAVRVTVGDGELSYDEKRPLEYELDRGELDDVTEADQEPMDVSMNFRWDEIASIPGATTPTIEEALKQEGPAATWESSDPENCRIYAVDIIVEHVPRCADGYTEIVTLPDFRYEDLPHNYNDGSIACTGRCNVTQAVKERLALSN